jgi:glutamate/tyrosine decarboxylase-like PLP-dependent enzyme
VTIVANAGATDTGAIDPIARLAELARQYSIWLHVDGAYGLPGILDDRVSHLYKGLEFADSVTVDPHKWLGAPVGIGATFVRDRELLYRAFRQGSAPYLEGSFSPEDAVNSMDSMGIPWGDLGLELSAPARGVVVWAILREIGVEGLKNRICRHNSMARHLADRIRAHPDLELVAEPVLSICCFRYAKQGLENLDDFNRQVHRKMVRNGNNIPSTTVVDGKLVIRPCFIGARAGYKQADDLFEEFLELAESSAAES